MVVGPGLFPPWGPNDRAKTAKKNQFSKSFSETADLGER
jgi:hypothetical protein